MHERVGSRWRILLLAAALCAPGLVIPLHGNPEGRRADEKATSKKGAGVKARRDAVNKLIGEQAESLEKLYKQLHANPELSLQEVKTAARMSGELKKLGFKV